MTGSFRPNWASAPGDTIRDLLRERDWSVSEFAKRLRQPLEPTNELLDGRSTITIRTANNLVAVLGATVEFWMARDAHYRETVSRLNAEDREWLCELPLSDMLRFGWLTPAPRPSEEVSSCLEFFGVPSVPAWRNAYEGLQSQVVFRTSPKYDSRPASVAAWLRQGEREAESISCAPWDPGHFASALSEARHLTLHKNSKHFLRELQKLCAGAGVAVAVVRAPTGCRASGATRFLSPEKALVLLSFRYLSDDQFWFTFFHEAAHLLLHPRETLFLEGLDGSSERQEQEADAFAERVLVPAEFRGALLSLPGDTRAIIRFARQIGIAPGIVVGQLQHYRRIPPHHFNWLKRRFQWTVDEANPGST